MLKKMHAVQPGYFRLGSHPLLAAAALFTGVPALLLAGVFGICFAAAQLFVLLGIY